jgi:hypothetical protein
MRTALRARRSIVTFRLSNEEYDFVKLASAAANSRSLSDYARQAVMRRIKVDKQPLKTEADLSGITACLERLDAVMAAMDGKLSTLIPPEVHTDDSGQ